MKIKHITILTFLLISFLSFSQNGQKNFIDQPYIEVTGQVETKITPNEIYLRIVLNENDKKGRISIEKQENQMLSKLKSLNINLDENLSVLDFDGYYRKKFLSENQVSKKKTYQLIVNDGKTLGEVFLSLDEIDISNISIQKVEHSDIESLKSENKIKALKQAKEKASNYAIAINQTIGKALYVQEVQNYNNYRYQTNNLDDVVFREAISLKQKEEDITDLKIKPIILKSTILARFSLN